MEAELTRQLNNTIPGANPQPTALGTEPSRVSRGWVAPREHPHPPPRAVVSPEDGKEAKWGSNHPVGGQGCVLFQQQAFNRCTEQAGMGGAGGGIPAPGQVPVSPGAMRGALG